MNNYDRALAYHHTYHLFGQLLLHGATVDLYPFLQNVPELALVWPEEPDFDDVAAVHQTLFGFNVHPHESIFLGTDGLLGGEITSAVQQTYLEIGYQVIDDVDHIGRELEVLAFLCMAEAEAWEDDEMLIAQQMRHKQRLLMQNHLLCWIWPFSHAVGQHEAPLEGVLVSLLTDVLVTHAGQLSPLAAGFSLPPRPKILDNEKTSLKDIAKFLVTPAHSGIYISRDMIGRIGRHFDLPRGFGGREQMLVNLMRSAVQFDQFSALLEFMQELTRKWYDDYQSQSVSVVASFVWPWAERVQETIKMLGEIQEKASEIKDEA